MDCACSEKMEGCATGGEKCSYLGRSEEVSRRDNLGRLGAFGVAHKVVSGCGVWRMWKMWMHVRAPFG